MRRPWLVLLTCGFVLSGCTGYMSPNYLMEGKRKQMVRQATESFAANLRWGRYPEAAARVEKGQRIAFLKMVDSPQSRVRFTDFEVLMVELGPEKDQATALVNFNVHRLPSLKEVRFQDEQSWRYEPETGGWYLEPNLGIYREAGIGPAR